MSRQLETHIDFLTDVERLKLVPCKAYVSDPTRRKNSAGHSWHLSIEEFAP
jgi:hypothetical protein